MASRKNSMSTPEYIYGADEPEVMDSSTLDPSVGPEDTTVVLVALTRNSDGAKIAVDVENYSKFKKGYTADGAIIRNEDNYVDILIGMDEGTNYFATNGIDDMPEDDARRRHYTNPTFTDMDGKERTENFVHSHPSMVSDNCAICFCKHYKDGSYWLPSGCEIGLAYNYVDKVNEVLSAIGGVQFSTETEYWTSTPFSEDYVYSFHTEKKEYHFWHSKKTVFNVRPIKGSEKYIYTE